jgi:DNA helicase II / ATP-dependent DNA helicase PcrA
MQSTANSKDVVINVNHRELLEGLNNEQREAVCLNWGPALVAAGAGSGKTTVLTRRVAYLLSELQQAPWSILAVTFTNKAAAEMRNRLENLVGVRTARQLALGTFHSICARLLRMEIETYASPQGHKWKTNYVIYDETDALAVVKDVVARLDLDDKSYPAREIYHRISSLKNDGITAQLYAQDARRYADQKFSEIFNNYQASLAANNALDFDDLILTFSQILESNEEVRTRLQERFKHVLVDEFQDTNQSQYKLVRLLCPSERGTLSEEDLSALWNGRSLMVVGDVDQSIYSWRKADYRIFLGFQNDYKSCRLIKLEENYRSTATIIDAANSVIKNNSERIDKVLRCNRGKGGKLRLHAGSDEIDEAYFVAEELKRLAARGIKLSDCAILYRVNSLSRALEEVLVRSHLPYTIVGGTRFYERAEIKDMLAYLKFIYNPLDTHSFKRCINNPRRGLGKTSLDHLLEHALKTGSGPLDACLQAPLISTLSARAAKSFSEFAQMAAGWQNMATFAPVSMLLSTVISQSGFLKALQDEAGSGKDETAAGRVENVKELLAVAQEFESTADEPTLEAFLTRISLVSDLDALKEGEDAVKLMTIHSAKGLEFQNVFMVGLEHGLFPHSRSFDRLKDMEEERRLMYVGITRAEERLYLTYARKRATFAQGGFSNYTIPSSFLSEISSELIMGLESISAPQDEEDYSERQSGMNAGGPRSFGSGSPERETYRERSAQSSGGFARGQSARPQEPPRQTTPEKPRVLSRSGPIKADGQSDSAQSGISPQADFERLKVDDRVMHTKFGTGVVVEVIGEGNRELYAVKFAGAGKRLLDPRFAKLVKLD